MENKIFLESEIDVLVGGTPCQPFSVAGLRKGLEDPRGNLMLTFLALIDKKRPKWVVWENVPGVLSTNGGKDFQSFLDGLSELGYICDVEILDAQFFGVAQRRRRVFVCAQSREDFLRKKTNSSALTIAQCLVEILHSIFRETLGQSGRELLKLEQIALSKDGVKRRMSLFEIATENCAFKILQNHLVDAFLKSQPEVRHWEFQLGGKVVPDSTLEDLLMGSKKTNPYILTEESLRKCLEEVYEVMKSFITLTSTNKITPHQIYICLKAERLIGSLICRLSDSSPSSLGAGLSFLMYNQEVTNYARQASRELFEELDGVHSWSDILWQTQHTSTIIGYIGDWRAAAAVLFERNSLSGHPAESREKRKATAADAERGSGGGGFRMTAFGEYADDNTASTLKQRDYKDATDLVAQTFSAPAIGNIVKDNVSGCITKNSGGGGETQNPAFILEPKAYAFKVREGSEDNTGEQGGTPGKKAFTIGSSQDQQIAQPVPFRKLRRAQSKDDHETWVEDEKANTINTFDVGDVRTTQEVVQPIAVDVYNQSINATTHHTLRSDASHNEYGAVLQPMSVDFRNQNLSEDVTGTIQSKPNGGYSLNYQPGILQPTMAIRRLTPTECERLQGFPDDWTLIPYRNKPADQCPDGPRYKACGNSMAVPVMRWIGERIQMVESILAET
jgi:DNA-cytosine methyltransferase